MGDLVHHLTLCAAVPAVTHSAERHVAQASSPVPDPAWSPQVLTDPETVWDLLQEGP